MGRDSNGAAKARARAKVPLRQFIDQRLIDALSHPARAHVLATLNERVSSPSEVAKEIGVDVRYLSYHFEALERKGLIELVGTEQRRGATKHYYRAKGVLVMDDREWTKALLVDGKGWEDLNSVLLEALEAVLAIEAESAERIAGTDAEPTPATVAMMSFEAARQGRGSARR